MSDDLEILKLARDLIINPLDWTQRADARNKAGAIRCIDESDTAQYCLYGAIKKVKFLLAMNVRDPIGFNPVHRYLERYHGGPSITIFNDHNDHTMVIKIINCIIKELEVDNNIN